MSEWEGNVQVNSCTNFAESFKIIVPSTACAVGKEQDCRAALQGATASVQQTWTMSSNTWTGHRQTKSKEKKIFKESLKSSNWRKTSQAFSKERDLIFYLPLESGAFPLCFSSLRCRRMKYMQISTCLRASEQPFNIDDRPSAGPRS